MLINNDEEFKVDVGEGKKIKNILKWKKFCLFLFGKCFKIILSIVYWLSFNIESEIFLVVWISRILCEKVFWFFVCFGN